MFLAVRLLLRWRHGVFATVPGGRAATTTGTACGRLSARSAIGLVHGMGGSAGVGVLLLAAIPDQTVAIGALLVLALFTAVSMTARHVRVRRHAHHPERRPVGRPASRRRSASRASRSGVWYAAAAWSLAPYPF